MGFPVHLLCRFGTWRVGETKDFLPILVDPVFGILDAIFFLRFHIFRVSLCDVFRGRSLVKIMDVHV